MKNNRVEMNEKSMDQVNGGYYLPNTYESNVYAVMGIKVIDNFWSKDEFRLPDGTITDMAGANAYANENYLIEDISCAHIAKYKITDKKTGKVIYEDPRA